MGNDISCVEVEDASCCSAMARKQASTTRQAEVGRMKVLHSSSQGHSSACDRPPLSAGQRFAEAAVIANRGAGDVYHTAKRLEEMHQRQQLHLQTAIATPALVASTKGWTEAAGGRALMSEGTQLRDPEAAAPARPPLDAGGTSSGPAFCTIPSHTDASAGWLAKKSSDNDELGNIGEEHDMPRREEYVNTILLLRRELGNARRQAQKSNERFVQHFLKQPASTHASSS